MVRNLYNPPFVFFEHQSLLTRTNLSQLEVRWCKPQKAATVSQFYMHKKRNLKPDQQKSSIQSYPVLTGWRAKAGYADIFHTK